MAPPADALVHGLKYEGWPALAGEMGRAMAAALERRLLVPGTLVTCVPTTERRRKKRGYNQARLLSEAVSRELGIPLVDTLVRSREGPTQVALPPSRRKANVRGAFRPVTASPSRVSGAHVVLVDDVLTTGATAAQAASVLSGIGAAEVTVLTYARALPSGQATPR
jgi:ComF family protein